MAAAEALGLKSPHREGIKALNPGGAGQSPRSLPAKKPEFPFFFYVPGIMFVLQVGKQISDYERQLCFYSDPLHPIIVANLAKDFYGLVGRHTAKAVRSKEVSDYLNAKRVR